MKRLIAKLAAVVTLMKNSFDHMLDAYAEAVDELKGTPAYLQLFETCEII